MLIIIYPVSPVRQSCFLKIIKKNFMFFLKNDTEKFGIAGLILVVAGLFGSVIGGILLDKTKAFKFNILFFISYFYLTKD
jgi:hypothetical protein